MANQGIVEITPLPAAPLDAAAQFHDEYVPQIRSMMADGDVVAVFPSADHTHDVWRRAALQELAREAVPFRVNGVTGDDTSAVSETLFYLQSAEGVTGQILMTDSNFAQVD